MIRNHHRGSSSIRTGRTYPLGATLDDGGVNFALFSKAAKGVDLLLFDDVHAAPTQTIRLDPRVHRTFHYWHIWVGGIGVGQLYAFRVDGCDKVLIDPYAHAVAIGPSYDRAAAKGRGDNTENGMKSVVADLTDYDWEEDAQIQQPFAPTVIYEMHVRGFTKHESSGLAPEKRGTYAGLVEKIPYLVELGVTAVELLPVFQFDRQDAARGLENYWGYSPISFFAPHAEYSVSGDPLEAINEFRDMVKALHRAGLEVILDVVYNHTAEGDVGGPTFCFKALGDDTYYLKQNGGYANFSGTGNTMNANQSTVRRLILDSLHFWVEQMHVDGFRFDLASILARDESGEPLANPPILWDIESDPTLAGTKLIAEAWDAAGLYQVGSFIGDHWKEWNGQFRDDVRAFMKSDRGQVRKIASRFLASPDIYMHEGREAEQSVNFITCHDGFTLNDLVSYDHKSNEANGEDNRDGTTQNFSWNCGVEGPTDDPAVEALRLRQIKNFFSITLLSLGVPMLLMGDEVRRTQQGNNNAYCQDNEVSWFDWRLVAENRELLRFVGGLIRLRQSLNIFYDERDMSLEEFLHDAPLVWHGVELQRPDYSDDSRSIAFTVQGQGGLFHVILNAFWEPLEFALPPRPSGWRVILDTDRAAPDDLRDWREAQKVEGGSHVAGARSVVGLVSRRNGR